MSHPQISLPSGYDRIQLRIDIGWHFPDIRTDARLPVLRPGFTTGYLVLSGRLRYAPEAGDFYLQNLVIHDGHFPGLPATYDQEARTILEFAAGTYVGNTPVYSLRDKGIKEAFGHWMLRSVTIEDRELVVALGIPIP